MFDRIRTGWFSVHVTSHPDKIFDALNASVAVLREVGISPINRRELARCVGLETFKPQNPGFQNDGSWCQRGGTA